MHVILTGLRGTGSSVGKCWHGGSILRSSIPIHASKSLAGCRIAAIVAQHGWEHFQPLERQVVTQVAAADRHAVAVGGGTLIDEENTRLLKNAWRGGIAGL